MISAASARDMVETTKKNWVAIELKEVEKSITKAVLAGDYECTMEYQLLPEAISNLKSLGYIVETAYTHTSSPKTIIRWDVEC